MQKRKWFLSLSLVLLIALVAGCQNIGYYKQAFSGQMQMLSSQQPIPQLIADPKTPAPLKQKFELILALRTFARTNLNLETKGHYLSYVDLHRSNAVWNVYAAPELSTEPKSWWYPVVGSVTYRGYFAEKEARKYADKLRKQGLDVFVGGIDAYSTLGWFKDPVLNTFIDGSDRRLAALIFHELSHQRVFIPGDTEFNEAFATAVAEEGLRRWLLMKNDAVALAKYKAELGRKKEFLSLIKNARAELREVYSAVNLDSKKRDEKKRVFQKLQTDYAALKIKWGGNTGYDDWFADSVNNAKLNTVSTYYDLVPAFHQLIENNGGNLEKFFANVKTFSQMSKPKRHQTLAQIKLTDSNQFLAQAAPPKPDEALPK